MKREMKKREQITKRERKKKERGKYMNIFINKSYQN